MATRYFEPVQETLLQGESSLSTERETLLAAIGAIGAGRYDLLENFMTPDVELRIYGWEMFAGTWKGVESVAQATKTNFAKLTEQKPQIVEMLEQPGAIAVRLHESGLLAGSNKPYEMRGMIWYGFRDGRISRIEEFLEAEKFVEAAVGRQAGELASSS